jgi:hypothetical protein
MRIIPEQVAANCPGDTLLPSIVERLPIEALDQALYAISTRYGMRTADVVAMQLEYPGERAPR